MYYFIKFLTERLIKKFSDTVNKNILIMLLVAMVSLFTVLAGAAIAFLLEADECKVSVTAESLVGIAVF